MKIRRLLVSVALFAAGLASLDRAGRIWRAVGASGDSLGDLLIKLILSFPFGLISVLVFALALRALRRPIDRSRWVRSNYSERFKSQR